MLEFIAALREFRRPLVFLAAAILVLQTLVAGLGAPAMAQIAAGGFEAGVICHGDGHSGGPERSAAAHDCCTFCTAAGPAALDCKPQLLDRLELVQTSTEPEGPPHLLRIPRAIRAGPSQAPPVIA